MRKYSFRNFNSSVGWASDPSVPTWISKHYSTKHELTNFTYTVKLNVGLFISSCMGTGETLVLVCKVRKPH